MTHVNEIGGSNARELNQVIRNIQTTSDGEWVYFRDYCDLWRIPYGGGYPLKVIDDTAVQPSEGKGVSVGAYAISDDGSRVVFTLNGYIDPKTRATIWNDNVFALDASGYQQLTNDERNVPKTTLAISGDGETITFIAERRLYAMRAGGSAWRFHSLATGCLHRAVSATRESFALMPRQVLICCPVSVPAGSLWPRKTTCRSVTTARASPSRLSTTICRWMRRSMSDTSMI